MRNHRQKTKKESIEISPEFDFFVHNPLTKYEGRYVAILGRKVIASGKSAKEVWGEAKKRYPNSLPTIAKIPKEEILVMIWR